MQEIKLGDSYNPFKYSSTFKYCTPSASSILLSPVIPLCSIVKGITTNNLHITAQTLPLFYKTKRVLPNHLLSDSAIPFLVLGSGPDPACAGLICDFCPSNQRFTNRLFQIPPHDEQLFDYTFSTIRAWSLYIFCFLQI